MSLTENYIVPDFYYTESGIPTLYTNNNNGGKKISNYQISESESENLNSVQNIRTSQSFTPMLNQSTPVSLSSSCFQLPQPSTSSSSLLFKNSLSSQSYNYSTTLSSTPICYKSTTSTTTTSQEIPTTTLNRLRNINNNCDKNNQNSFKINLPKKLLIKRGTIYQTEPPPPSIRTTTKMPTKTQEETVKTQQKTYIANKNIITGIATGKNIQNISNNSNSNNHVNIYTYNNNGGNSNGNDNSNNLNCGENTKNNELLNWNFLNDKQRKTYRNNQIKELQKYNEQKLRGNEQNRVLPLSSVPPIIFQQSTNNHLYCPKTGSVIIKKLQQNINNKQQQKMDNRITYSKNGNFEIFDKNNIWNSNCNSCDKFIYQTDFLNFNNNSNAPSDVDNNKNITTTTTTTLNNSHSNNKIKNKDSYYDENKNTDDDHNILNSSNEYDDDDLNDF